MWNISDLKQEPLTHAQIDGVESDRTRQTINSVHQLKTLYPDQFDRIGNVKMSESYTPPATRCDTFYRPTTEVQCTPEAEDQRRTTEDGRSGCDKEDQPPH